MVIKTIYNVGDRVYFIHDKRIINRRIERVVIEVNHYDLTNPFFSRIKINYILNFMSTDGVTDLKKSLGIEEKYLFNTREELINSL